MSDPGLFGMVCSPPYTPDAVEVQALKPAFNRSIMYDLTTDVPRLVALGRPFILTVNGECAQVRHDWSGWDRAMEQIAALPEKPFAVCVGNEFDLWWKDNPNDVPPSFAADLVHRASFWLRPVGIKVVATSVASAVWPEYLRQMAALCWNAADWFDFHGYGQRPDGWGHPGWMHGDLRNSLLYAQSICQKPVIMSEYGVKIVDAGGEHQVAEFLEAAYDTVRDLGPAVCPYVGWFAWRDQVGQSSEQGPSAFGMRAADGRQRPAWFSFAELPDKEEPPVPTHVHDVGPGLLEWMREASVQPVACSTFLPLGRNPAEIECAYADDGTEFRWSLVENRRLARLARVE